MILPWTASLLIAGAWCAPTTEKQDKKDALTLINPTLFPLLTRYATFASSSYTVPCRHPPYGASVVKYVNINTTDTQATIFEDNVAKEIIVAFPGTSSAEDHQTDLEYNLTTLITPGVGPVKCPGCEVHFGALQAYNSIAPSLEFLLTVLRQQKPTYAMTITGHSLGASLANLAYASLKGLGYPIGHLYTFGSPRVGNPKFATYMNEISGASDAAIGRLIRVTHKNDTVPQLPPEQFGYMHTLTEIFLDLSGAQKESAANTYRCQGPENVACSKGNCDIFKGGSGHGFYANVWMGVGATC